MRFSLQDIKKTIHRRNGELAVSLHFLRAGDLREEIEHLIAYYEALEGRPQRQFSLDEARACIGEYRLAHCLIAILSNWYLWKEREWVATWHELDGSPALNEFSSPIQLRLALYNYVNEHYQGFLETQGRTEALHAFAAAYHLSVDKLEYLLALDSEEEALLTRISAQPPTALEVVTLYNQWVFEAALFNASSVYFVIDCQAFALKEALIPSGVGTGAGAAIKRLCYLARRLGVYYDLTYESIESTAPLTPKTGEQLTPQLLTLTLYGPQEVTGVPQQYGLRLARLCRLLLDYAPTQDRPGRSKHRPSLAGAVVEAEATIHFLQRSYHFAMDARLLQLLPLEAEVQRKSEGRAGEAAPLFDSSIEQAFSEAFVALANSQGVDGWHLQREPEPLLLDHSIFIPDFALTRAQHRIYVEILGFWTPSYRERKLQKLHALRGRKDLLLAIPVEAKAAFMSIVGDFPIVYYNGQLSITELLQVLRSCYDDFAERLEGVDVKAVQERVRDTGLLVEQECYAALHCYRRGEIQRVAELIVGEDIAFVPGIGLYQRAWLEQLQKSALAWLRTVQPISLADAVHEIRVRYLAALVCEDTTIEALLGLWPEVSIRRDSIFDAQVEIVDGSMRGEIMPPPAPAKVVKKPERERRAASRKRSVSEVETIQADLWG